MYVHNLQFDLAFLAYLPNCKTIYICKNVGFLLFSLVNSSCNYKLVLLGRQLVKQPPKPNVVKAINQFPFSKGNFCHFVAKKPAKPTLFFLSILTNQFVNKELYSSFQDHWGGKRLQAKQFPLQLDNPGDLLRRDIGLLRRTQETTQCRKFIIFPSLRIYVKSILRILEVQDWHIIRHLVALNFDN